MRLLLDGGMSPQRLALAVMRRAGELGASVAVADGFALERVMSELADFIRRAGREHHDLLRLEGTLADPARGLRISPLAVAKRKFPGAAAQEGVPAAPRRGARG